MNSQLCKEDIRRTLKLFHSPDEIIEIRALGVDNRERNTSSGYFNDVDDAVEAIANLDASGKPKGIYHVLNQCKSELLARSKNKIKRWASTTTSDADIERLRWLYVDIDPERASGISSSADELEASVEVREYAGEVISKCGFSKPIVAMSGNGWHLLVPLDMPNDEESRKLVDQTLNMLADIVAVEHSCAKVDRTCDNPSRIAKIYGTVARKGESIEERPHRTAEFVYVPDYITERPDERMSKDELNNAVARLKVLHKESGADRARRTADALPTPSTNGSSGKYQRNGSAPHANDRFWNGDKLDVPAWLNEQGIEINSTSEKTGCTWYHINCPFNNDHKGTDAAITQGSDGALGFKCHHNSCSDKRWIDAKEAIGGFPSRRLAENAERIGPIGPADPPKNGSMGPADPPKNGSMGPAGHANNASSVSTIADTNTTGEIRFEGIDISELEKYADEPTDWVVENIFASDQPTIFGARSKAGKTTQLADLTIALASGTKWLGFFEVPRRRRTLFVTGEANRKAAAKVLRKACSARDIAMRDLEGWARIEAVDFPKLPEKNHVDDLVRVIEKHQTELLIIDPLYRGLSGLDTSKVAEVGEAIVNLHRRCSPAAIFLSHHTIKSSAREYGLPPELEDLTGAGIAESCGNWWLLGRNEPYAYDMMHDLCVTYGGRDAQAGAKRILFDERKWEFHVEDLATFREGERQERETAKAMREVEKDEERKRRFWDVMLQHPNGETVKVIRESCGLNTAHATRAIQLLRQENRILDTEVVKSNRHKPYPAIAPNLSAGKAPK